MIDDVYTCRLWRVPVVAAVRDLASRHVTNLSIYGCNTVSVQQLGTLQ